jgi:hypothetical protein
VRERDRGETREKERKHSLVEEEKEGKKSGDFRARDAGAEL